MQGHPVELISPLGSDVDPVGILDVMQGCADVRAYSIVNSTFNRQYLSLLGSLHMPSRSVRGVQHC